MAEWWRGPMMALEEALIDDAVQALGVMERVANTIAARRDGADERLARQVAEQAKRAAGKLVLIEREDDAP